MPKFRAKEPISIPVDGPVKVLRLGKGTYETTDKAEVKALDAHGIERVRPGRKKKNA